MKCDRFEAFKLYKLASAVGYAMAQFYLAFWYESGTGIAIDKVEAVKWYKLLAIEWGNTYAQK